MQVKFIAFACVVGLALAAIVREERADVPPPAATARPAPAVPRLTVSQRDRDAVYSYYGIDHAEGDCPPGLSKESYGCLPASGGRGSWTIGKPLAGDVLVYPLPAVLLGQLSPPPNGYQYGRIGNDVLILANDSRLVAAAVAGVDR